jgi:hypothetical protein
MLNINLIMARAAQAAKSFTRTAKWMQTADYSKSVIITTAKVSLYVPIRTRKKVEGNSDLRVKVLLPIFCC